MENTFEQLNLFFDKIKTITFWQRIFGWRIARSMSYDAYEEFKSLMALLSTKSTDLDTTKNSYELLKNDSLHLQQDHNKIENDLRQLQEKYTTQTTALQELRNEFTSQNQELKNTQTGFNQQKERIATLEEKGQYLEGENRKLEKTNNQFDYINIGTGNGNSVLEIVETFKRVTGAPLSYQIGNRRAGDVEQVYASVDKSKKILDWEAELNLEDALRDAWNWQLTLK